MIDFERTFDNAAVGYDKSRPAYPAELYRDIFEYGKIDENSNVLEIGLGTGKASEPILETGCHLVGVEPGENLARLAMEKFKDYSNFSLYMNMLQDYDCPTESYDFIYSATAFHWIPEEYGYKRVYELLKHGGVFARFAYHAGPDKERKMLTDEIQKLYALYFNATQSPKVFTDEDAGKIAEIAGRYGFSDLKYRLYEVVKHFTADEYMELLQTYPNHMSLEPCTREKLFKGIHSAINNYGGVISVYYTVDLELARKA